MLRVTGWCLGLFGAGAAIARSFPSTWVQPIVLLALGMAFLFVSRAGAAPARSLERSIALPSRAAQPKTSPTPAPVAVEQSA